MAGPTATVVVVSRDRWSPSPSTLDALLARTDPRHRVVVVDGAAPRPVRSLFDRVAATGRIGVVRRGRFLGSNEARNVGADGVRTEWVAFIENDVVPSDGWLDELLAVGEARGAASVFPTYLEPGGGGGVVHGTGAELERHGPDGRRLREHQHHIGRQWQEVAPELEAVERVQSEPHLLLVRRDLLETIGGFDEGLLSWFDHTDLALHHQRLGAPSWYAPHVTCCYFRPPPVALRDLPSFVLRWGDDWYARSLAHLCATWDLDPLDHEWEHHAAYRASLRRSIPTPWFRVNAVGEHVTRPLARVVTRRWDARRAAVRSDS